jgi:hypothetical protein
MLNEKWKYWTKTQSKETMRSKSGIWWGSHQIERRTRTRAKMRARIRTIKASQMRNKKWKYWNKTQNKETMRSKSGIWWGSRQIQIRTRRRTKTRTRTIKAGQMRNKKWKYWNNTQS